MKDPYEVLGVSRSASDDEIQKAYRKKAMEWHPDRHPPEGKEEAAEKFKEIASAFEVLSSPEKRHRFDQFGTTGDMPGFGGGKPFTSPMDDFMSQFFGRREQRPQGRHVVVEHEVTLEEVLNGGVHEIHYQRPVLCEKCKGVGGVETICTVCNGSGCRIIYGAALTVKTSCQNCGGSGRVVGERCGECHDGFRPAEEKTVNFKIPPGVESGMRFSYQGMGEPVADGIPGNLYLVIQVRPHETFERLVNGNVLLKVPVSYSQLVLGDEIMVPTLTEKAMLKVPSGTQPGSKFKLRGMGLPRFNGRPDVYNRGDEIVQLELEVPVNPEGRYRELIVELAQLEKQNVTPKKKSFAEKAGA